MRRDRLSCGSAPCARQAYGAVHPSVTVAHKCAPTRVWQARAARPPFLWERTLCATNLRSGTPQRDGRAQVRSYRGLAGPCGATAFSVGAHPVRDKPTERHTSAWPSRTECAPTEVGAGGETRLPPKSRLAPAPKSAHH